jgi:hypothetical protein
MAVPKLAYGIEIRTVTKTGSRNWNRRNIILVECRRLDKERRNKKEELNIFNLNDKIIKSKSQWKYHMQLMKDRLIWKKILTYKPKRKRNIRRPHWRQTDLHTPQENGADHVWSAPWIWRWWRWW